MNKKEMKELRNFMFGFGILALFIGIILNYVATELPKELFFLAGLGLIMAGIIINAMHSMSVHT